MGITDMIAGFIQEALDDAGGVLEMQRGDLAQRFSPEHGYIVESRRGGGGYIRITRVHVDRQTLMMHVINSIGSEIDPASARAILSNLVQSEAIPAQTGKLLVSLLSDTALRSVPKDQRSVLRADLLKQALIHLV